MSKFKVGDKVRLMDQYHVKVNNDFIKNAEYLVISKITQRKIKKTFILNFENDPNKSVAYSESAFELYQELENWEKISEEEKKLFIREIIGSMYMDKKLYSAIKKLINQSNTQKTHTT